MDETGTPDITLPLPSPLPRTAGEAEQELHVRAADILERMGDAFIALDSRWRIVYANHEACRINQKPLEAFQGKIHWDEWPASVGTQLESQFRRVMTERVEAHFEHRYVSEPYDVWLEVDVYPAPDGINVLYRDISARKRAEDALRASEQRFRQMADAIPHIAWTTGADGSVEYYNQRWYDYSGLTLDETRGWGWEAVIHPGDLERAGGVWREAVAAGTVSEVEYRLRRADGEYRWHLGRSVPVREDEGIVRWVGTATDIEDQRRAAEALRRSQEDLQMAVAGAQIGTFYCDWPLDKIIWNDTCKRHFFLPLDADVDFDLFYTLLHPDDREPTRQAIERAMADRVAYDVEYRTLAPDGRTRWINAVGRFHYGPDGTPIRFDGITLDISERRQADAALAAAYRREALLNQIGQEVLHASGPREIQQCAVDVLGQALGVDRCYVHFFDPAQDATWIETDWHREGLASVTGRYPLSVVQPVLLDDLFRHGASVRIEDVRESYLHPETVVRLDQAGYRAVLTTPFYSQGKLSAVLALVMTETPRAWTDDESALAAAVAAQTRSAVESARLLDEQQARLRQEALIGRIGAAIRTTLEPEAVLRVAVRELGQALGADRCYYATYDQEADSATADPDWHRDGLLTIAGTYPMSRFIVNRDPAYQSGRTQVVEDTGDDPATGALGLRSLVRVPLVSGTAMTTLAVAMADRARQWTGAEVALIEAVATQTQTVLEAVRVRRREHTIAEQLAKALQPETPAVIPGMDLAEYYRPALEDQGVGGDFSDVFSVDKDATFLVVGDLSGKGLTAASQVAMVRHMLRFALYTGETVAGAVTRLNVTLTDHDLLSGFSTLFVGRYEATLLTLTYVNCGQDPGLVLRAVTGDVETLPPTGPVLGAISGAVYTEETVVLQRGDVLALYTDGLTEAGPSRRSLLLSEGVADLLQGQTGGRSAGEIVAQLMAGVDAYAKSGIRDDQCVLVGVVRG